MITTWYSHSHLAGLTLVIVHREVPFVCLAAHESGVSAVDDCRKCRTATATPAEPGDLLWMLENPGHEVARNHLCLILLPAAHCVRRKAYGPQVGRLSARYEHRMPGSIRSQSNIGLPPMLRCAKPRPFPTLELIRVCSSEAALAPVRVGTGGIRRLLRPKKVVPICLDKSHTTSINGWADFPNIREPMLGSDHAVMVCAKEGDG
jgi:hypothetical protein